jgi:anaerobic ribonucleoside-triphosphate reductase activating protein
MFYSEIKEHDIANGEGVRTSLFVSGCRLHCRDCFNRATWDFSYGSEFTAEVEERLLQSLAPDYIAGLTILGGEPMEEENQQVLLPFLRTVKARYPHKVLWVFSGYRFEDALLPGGLKHTAATDELLRLIDILVDGPFIRELKSAGLTFRGSTNQRLLNVPESLRCGKAIAYRP